MTSRGRGVGRSAGRATIYLLCLTFVAEALPARAAAQRPSHVDSAATRVCEWEGWLPPEVGRTRYRDANPLDRHSEAALLRLLESANEHDRERAARALASGRDSLTVTALLRHVNDPNGVVRDAAIRSLGRTGAARAEPALLPLLDHASKHTRQAAVWSLGQLQNGGAAGALIVATHDTSEHVRADAAWALGLVGEPTALPRLRDLSTSEVTAVKVAAVCAIGWLRGSLDNAIDSDTSVMVRAAVRWSRARHSSGG